MKNTVTYYVRAGVLLGVPLAARAQSPPPPTQTFMDGFAGGTTLCRPRRRLQPAPEHQGRAA